MVIESFYGLLLTGMILHDPTSMATILDPTLFTSRKEVVRVGTEGVLRGFTLLDKGLKKYVLKNLLPKATKFLSDKQFLRRLSRSVSLYSLIWDFFGILRQLQI